MLLPAFVFVTVGQVKPVIPSYFPDYIGLDHLSRVSPSVYVAPLDIVPETGVTDMLDQFSRIRLLLRGAWSLYCD